MNRPSGFAAVNEAFRLARKQNDTLREALAMDAPPYSMENRHMPKTKPLFELEAAREAVQSLAHAIGYGRVIQFCMELWREDLVRIGCAGAELTLGRP